jgi:hypothetical protein
VPSPITWWELDRTDHAVARLARPWLAHDGRIWAMVEIENIGDSDLGIDYLTDDDELHLAFHGPIARKKRGIRDDVARAKLARIRFEEGSICARLSPGERWRVHSTSLDLARVQQVASASVDENGILRAGLSGTITLVTEANTYFVRFKPPPAESEQVSTIDLGPRPALTPMIEPHPERIHARFHDLTSSGLRAAMTVIDERPPIFHCWGFARDRADIPPALRGGLAELGAALNQLPDDAINLKVCGYIEVDSSSSGPGAQALAHARAIAVVEALGLTRDHWTTASETRSRPAPDPTFGDAWWRCVEVSPWPRTPEWSMDLLRPHSVSPGALLTSLRQVPEVHALLGDGRVTSSHLRAVWRRGLRVISWLLAPSRICDWWIGPNMDRLMALAKLHGPWSAQRSQRFGDLTNLVSGFGPECEALARIYATGIDPDTVALPSNVSNIGRRCLVRVAPLRAMAPDERLLALTSMASSLDLDDELAPALVVAIADARLEQDQHGVFAPEAWSRFERMVTDVELEDLLRSL